MQNNNRLGCLTGAGIFSAFITVAVIVGAAFISGAQMFSAGALNAQAGDETLGGVTAHAQITECSACHAAPLSSETMGDRCVQCHQDVAAQRLDSNSLHNIIAQKNPAATCRTCHPEHRGAAAVLTEFNNADFPHEALGYSLNGHQLTALKKRFACADCHAEDYGFSLSTCDQCHRQMDMAFMDAHKLAFGAECLACHDGIDRYGRNFNHAKYFPLEGKHVAADCAQCHGVSRSAADFQAASAACASCHQKDDAHLGTFGTACGVCHSPEAWKPAKFNHDLAAFKLEGKHVSVACETCHANNVYKGTPTTCYACHQKDDKHNGSFGVECSGCHTAASWQGATFDHNRTKFPLNGSHAGAQCEQCHKGGVFTGLSATCASCHADPAFHAGAFGTQCEACHNTTTWSPAGFNLAHPEPRVGEGGSGIRHGGATCRQCHPVTVRQSNCDACHRGGFEGGEGEGGDD